MSENAYFLVRATTDYINRKTGILTRFIDDIPWQERERLLDTGQIEVACICGLPYVVKAAQPEL